MIRTIDRMDELTSYYTEYRDHDDSDPFRVVSFAEILAEWVEDAGIRRQRWEVLNRCEREPIPSLKRALIHERDGQRCVYCDVGGVMLTVDHVVPRSAFPEHMLRIADRSDNLVSACWPCNEQKSNYETIKSKKLGVTRSCWECENPAPEDEWDEDAYDEWGKRAAANRTHLVHCGRCGTGGFVPNLSWVL